MEVKVEKISSCIFDFFKITSINGRKWLHKFNIVDPTLEDGEGSVNWTLVLGKNSDKNLIKAFRTIDIDNPTWFDRISIETCTNAGIDGFILCDENRDIKFYYAAHANYMFVDPDYEHHIQKIEEETSKPGHNYTLQDSKMDIKAASAAPMPNKTAQYNEAGSYFTQGMYIGNGLKEMKMGITDKIKDRSIEGAYRAASRKLPTLIQKALIKKYLEESPEEERASRKAFIESFLLNSDLGKILIAGLLSTLLQISPEKIKERIPLIDVDRLEAELEVEIASTIIENAVDVFSVYMEAGYDALTQAFKGTPLLLETPEKNIMDKLKEEQEDEEEKNKKSVRRG